MSLIIASAIVGRSIIKPDVPAIADIGLWKLDETTGTTIVDATGIQNGTYAGSVSLSQNPMIASGSLHSVLFDGTSAYGSIPDNAQYGNLTAYTVSLIVQPSSAPAEGVNRCIFSKDQSLGALAGRLTIEHITTSGSSLVRVGAGSTTTSIQWLGSSTGAAEIAVDTAYRITVTVHPTNGSKFYVGGSEVGTASGGQAWQDVTFPILIAAHLASDGVSPQSFFHGFIDEVQLWPFAMSATDVAALPAAVTITGSGGTPNPSAANDSFGPFTAGTTQDLDVRANDSNLTNNTITIQSNPSAGTVSVINNTSATAKIRYVLPSPTSQTVYTFTYSVDGSNNATVSVTVNGTGGTAPNFFTSTAQQAAYINTGPKGTDTYDWSSDPPPYNPTNPKAATFTPSPWNCKMCRLTGYHGTPILIGGVTDTGLTFDTTHGHDVYSTQGANTFNADGSLFLLGTPNTHGGRTMLLTSSDFLIRFVAGYAAKDISGPNVNNGFWHPTDSTKYLDIVQSGTNILVRQWTVDLTSGFHGVTTLRTIAGYNSGELQGQGRYSSWFSDHVRIGVEGVRVSDGVKTWFGYDITTGQKTQDLTTAPDGGPYEGGYISASGNYMVSGLAPWEGISGGRAFDVYNFGSPGSFVGERRTGQISHKTLWYDGTDDWYVGHATGSGSSWNSGDVLSVRLSDGLIRRLTTLGSWNYHGNCYDRRYTFGTSTSASLGIEIIAIRNSQFPNVWRRLGPQRAYAANIRDQPDPVGSRNGDMVIFDTNWQDPGETSTISSRRFPIMIYDLISHNGWDGG